MMAAIQAPQTIVVLNTQNHSVHIQSHLTALGALNQSLQQQQMTMDKVIPLMEPLMQHTIDHLQMLDAEDPSRPTFVSAIKQIREVVTNGAREIQAQQEKMMREAAHNGPQSMNPENENSMAGETIGMHGELPPQGLSSALLIHSAKAEQELEDMKIDRGLRIAESQRKAARDDALTAAKIAKMGEPAGTVP